MALLVAAVVAGVFAPALEAGFVKLDDPRMVLDNPLIEPLDAAHVWQMATSVRSNWHPLTWLSHAIDLALFGRDARGHHAGSVALHAANAAWMLLLFLSLTRTSAAAARAPAARLVAAAFAALAFALHPLRVESVAWVTERKDVLCAFFTLPCLLAWLHFGRLAGERDAATRARARRTYALALALFACALMSKPMAVSVPLLLLVLDFFPSRRLESRRELGARLVEKIPFFVGSLGVGVITIAGQDATGALLPLERMGLGARLLNVLQNLSFYLEKTLWPSGLSPRYPLDLHMQAGLGDALAALGIVAAITLLSALLLVRRESRALLAAWLGYAIALAPVSGLLHFGRVAAADRFSYLPMAGFHLLVPAALLGALVRARSTETARGQHGRLAPAAIATLLIGCGILAALALETRRQIGVWHDTLSLWGRVVEVFPGRLPRVHELRGHLYLESGNPDAAEHEYRAALAIAPRYPLHESLGQLLYEQGRLDEAEAMLREASRLQAGSGTARRRLAVVQLARGDRAAARASLGRALELDPGDAEAYASLGDLERLEGNVEDAEFAYAAAARLQPLRPDLLANLGTVQVLTGRDAAARRSFERALELDPRSFSARIGLARLASRSGRLREARGQLERAWLDHPGRPEIQQALDDLRILESRARAGRRPGPSSPAP